MYVLTSNKELSYISVNHITKKPVTLAIKRMTKTPNTEKKTKYASI